MLIKSDMQYLVFSAISASDDSTSFDRYISPDTILSKLEMLITDLPNSARSKI